MLIIDFETRSLCDLIEAGAHVYAAHPSTEILLLAYQIDGREPQSWEPGGADPTELLSLLASGRAVFAFNSAFDRQIWEHVTPAHWYRPAPTQWHDVMGIAAYRALPMSLDDCAEVLGVAQKKSKEGKALIRKYCHPISKSNQTFRPLTPEDRAAFREYALQDVRATAAVLERVGDLPADERAWWLVEQRINDRGVRLHIPAVNRAIEVAEAEADRINMDLSALTGGRVTSASQAARIAAEANAIVPNSLPDCTKGEVAAALALAEDPGLRRLLELRRDGSRASTKKLYKMARGAGEDWRARGLMQYHAATTGREGGRRVQPQNLLRPDEDFAGYGITPDVLASFPSAAEAIELLNFIYPHGPVRAIANMMRNFFIPENGHLFVAGDYSAVEARVNAALAGEVTKLQGFRDVDSGQADDIYCVTASAIYGRTIRKKTDKAERQVGKIAELASGFGGSVGAWMAFGADKLGWTEDAIKEKVKAWRAAHPRIVASWYTYEEAATLAVHYPGKVYTGGAVDYCVWRDWLLCRLPSGRTLHYFHPEPATGKFGGETFSFWANKPTQSGGRVWGQRVAYGGLLCENIVQAVSRDLMVAAVHRCEEAGSPVVLTVHDEVVTEVPVDRADPKVLEALMETPTTWSKGWPIKAEAWAGLMYSK